MLDVSLLGCGGMMPLADRFLTSLICRYNGRMILIDCGEGTQVSLKLLKFGVKKIDIICLTHFHADHILGLPGILLMIANSGRDEPISIIGPTNLKSIIKNLLVFCRELPFKINFIEIEKSNDLPIKINDFNIYTKDMVHREQCLSYKIVINRNRKFNKNLAIKNKVPKKIWSILQKGNDKYYEGTYYESDLYLLKERKGISICYSTDTLPMEDMKDFIYGCDLFICEGLYGNDENNEKAYNYMHMTFFDACKIAKQGKVEKLWLTHFSPSLTKPGLFLEETKKIFENTEIGFDRKKTTLYFK